MSEGQKGRLTRPWRRAAMLFAMFLLAVIATANLGLAGSIFGPIYAFPHGDKIAHFLLFGLLGLLAGLGFSPRRASWPVIRPLVSSLVIAAAVTIEEISQIAFAHRSFDLRDLAAGLLGIFLLGEIGARFHPEETE